MTRAEVAEEIHKLIKGCIQASGGSITHPVHGEYTYMAQVEKIFRLMGKLSPEVKHKPQLPPLNKKLLARARRLKERFEFTEEQRAAARRLIEQMGLE